MIENDGVEDLIYVENDRSGGKWMILVAVMTVMLFSSGEREKGLQPSALL